MRRLFVVFLLVLSALQSSWAVAAAYCHNSHTGQHEQAPAAAHLGHHEHEHGLAASEAGAPDDAAASLMPDLDCHACHACCVAMVTSLPAGLQLLPDRQFTTSLHMAMPVPPLQAPDRPRWLPLA